ncbi:MAG: S8 family serine peptidase [Vicinamibacterales bacterium]|nr:S8 family serine peptidase [Vicinamibacterales bacterium]
MNASHARVASPHWGARLRRPATLLVIAAMVLGGQVGPVEAQPGARGAKAQSPQVAREAGPSLRPSSRAARIAARQIAPRLDRALEARADRGGRSRVIVRLKPGMDIGTAARGLGGRMGRRLGLISGQVVELPNSALRALSRHPAVESIHVDRPVAQLLNRTAVTIGASLVHQQYGFTGRGIGVAVIDSGVTGWHDDLTGAGPTGYPYGNQRVRHFADFVGGQSQPYDDNGHGTHVAGTIAGSGYDSDGRRAGIAPDADLVVLKALDHLGAGYMSDVIAAFDYAVAVKDIFNIRVINLSIGAPISESYWTDPLTLAAKRAVDAGIVVVAAAGNLGYGPDGPRYGTVTAPANAPWVIAVGASNHKGTINRQDDDVAPFSSRGPTYIDWQAKPDIVAPGVGIVSLSDPNSHYYATRPHALLDGSVSTPYKPYLSLSGTSMASPVVAGSIALMLEANPTLTPNLVKAILQYTAESQPAIDRLSQGAGFLNTLGAVRLSRFFTDAQPGALYPMDATWSRHILWGNYRVAGGVLVPGANAWDDNIVWGNDWDNIVWGNTCGEACDNIVWGNDTGDDNIVWGLDFDNIVWGNDAGDNIVWGNDTGDNIVWGNHFELDNIVWGMDCGGGDCDNIVWGNSQLDNIVWGLDEDNIVWGNSLDDNIVWGLDFDDNIVWGLDYDDNIVWGLDDNIVWGNDTGDNIVWGFGGGAIGMWNPAEEVDPAAVTEPMIFGDAWPVSVTVPDEPELPQEPVIEEPVTEPVVEEPVTEPVVEEPVTEPAAEEFAIDEPVTSPTTEVIDGELFFEESTTEEVTEPTTSTSTGGGL